jgi:hypothetical protein
MPKPEKNSDIRLDRHSGSGLRGLPKKNGFKGWGTGLEDSGPEILDENDPNYVPPEEEIEIEEQLENKEDQMEK